ncbi:RrF2 family transcriptional regulator [Blautia sp. MSJ-19]|uniref:RrF2 family transcriptional regulator n=1 Tax=Blautia sp. MSJ-19 TaxID=2841517 RepID=UPI001C0EDBC0|nr:Rrf2 family transcriptional regulator [Blautia sp. MSJ-19]MBU5482339.1 Rrf2 family transcriptional regulator [Blautia sp. MSJ-19]
MLITRECDYAVRVLRAMAGEKRVSVNEICEKELITAPFAYKILKKLQKSGLVRGYRGVHGGYSLNCDLDKVTLYDVYTTIDPELFIIDCLEPGYDCARNGAGEDACLVHRELCEIQRELGRMLKSQSLAKLINV